jgi:hypothetical protein
MFGYRNFTPVGCRKRRGGHFHLPSIAASGVSMRPVSSTLLELKKLRCQFPAIRAILFLRLSPRLCCAVPRLFVKLHLRIPACSFLRTLSA